MYVRKCNILLPLAKNAKPVILPQHQAGMLPTSMCQAYCTILNTNRLFARANAMQSSLGITKYVYDLETRSV